MYLGNKKIHTMVHRESEIPRWAALSTAEARLLRLHTIWTWRDQDLMSVSWIQPLAQSWLTSVLKTQYVWWQEPPKRYKYVITYVIIIHKNCCILQCLLRMIIRCDLTTGILVSKKMAGNMRLVNLAAGMTEAPLPMVGKLFCATSRRKSPTFFTKFGDDFSSLGLTPLPYGLDGLGQLFVFNLNDLRLELYVRVDYCNLSIFELWSVLL